MTTANENMTKKQLVALIEKLHEKPVTTGRMVMLQDKSGEKYNAFISLALNQQQLDALQADLQESESGHAQVEVALSQSLERFWAKDPATGEITPTYFSTNKSEMGEAVTYKEYMQNNPKSKKYRLAG